MSPRPERLETEFKPTIERAMFPLQRLASALVQYPERKAAELKGKTVLCVGMLFEAQSAVVGARGPVIKESEFVCVHPIIITQEMYRREFDWFSRKKREGSSYAALGGNNYVQDFPAVLGRAQDQEETRRVLRVVWEGVGTSSYGELKPWESVKVGDGNVRFPRSFILFDRGVILFKGKSEPNYYDQRVAGVSAFFSTRLNLPGDSRFPARVPEQTNIEQYITLEDFAQGILNASVLKSQKPSF